MPDLIYIYAFPGMGKTTLCEDYGYVDWDIYHPTQTEITSPVVLTNDPTKPCVAYFLPEDYDTALARLSESKQNFFNEMSDYLRKQYNEILQTKNPTVKDYIDLDDVLHVLGSLRKENPCQTH